MIISKMRKKLFDHIKKKYGAAPEYLWKRYPDYAVFRHADNNKWFAIVMDVQRGRLGLSGDERVDILNVKLSDPMFADMLIQREGFFKGYHISKGTWVSILLDGTVPFDEIAGLLNESYMNTASSAKKQKLRAPKEWIIPSNPGYYDVVSAFEESDVIDWKQGRGIIPGDTVYLYVGAPVSAILYKCKVLETDIPCDYRDKNLTIMSLMKIKRQRKYDPAKFTFDVLKEEYGIYAVRGPRGIPVSLSKALKN